MSPKAKGVYSTKEAAGTAVAGMTPRHATPRKKYWLVWEHGENYVEAQPINKNLVTIGQKRLVANYEFKDRFTREPDFVLEADSGNVRPIWKRGPDAPDSVPDIAEDIPDTAPEVAEDDKVDLDNELLEADLLEDVHEVQPVAEPEPEPPQAPAARREELEQVEREVRSTFGLALSHLKRGNTDRARELFEKVAETEAPFETEHKHMFNEFGINLRKSSLPDVALKHYLRALQLSPNDENLHHNLARVYWELGDMENCERELRKSLELNPHLGYSARFLRYLRKHPKKKRGLFSDLLPRKGGERS